MQRACELDYLLKWKHRIILLYALVHMMICTTLLSRINHTQHWKIQGQRTTPGKSIYVLLGDSIKLHTGNSQVTFVWEITVEQNVRTSQPTWHSLDHFSHWCGSIRTDSRGFFPALMPQTGLYHIPACRKDEAWFTDINHTTARYKIHFTIVSVMLEVHCL